MCFAQDDLFKWGAALFLRFLGQSICEANMDARSLQNLVKILSLVRGRPLGKPQVFFENIVNRPYRFLMNDK